MGSERQLKPFFGDLTLADITTAHVRRYVAELVDGTAAGGTWTRQEVDEALVVYRRLGTFTVRDIADALGVSLDRARYLAERLERSGMIAPAGARRPAGKRGRAARAYRVVGRAGDLRRTEVRRPISAKTINNSLIVLRVALAHALEDGLIATNPAATTAGARERIKVAVEQPTMDFLRLSEIPQYLDACSAEYRPLAEVLIACGLRISEALALTWTDVDLQGSTLLVTGSRKQGRRSSEVSGGTKGDRFRGVEFGPRIERLLRDLRARQGGCGAADPGARPVFSGAEGQRLDRREISRGEHKHALSDAGLRRSIRLHDLRHTAAASWLAAGLPLIYVQRQLGHASITTTERQYGHLEKGFLRGAARRAEAAIWDGHPDMPEQPPVKRERAPSAQP